MEAIESIASTQQLLPDDDSFTVANLEFRPRSAEVLAGQRRTSLTIREFQTLYVLVKRPDRVVPRIDIYALVWGGTMTYRDRSVDVFVRKIRKKLAAVAPEWRYVQTHFGIGYRFSPERLRG